ncbi:HET-domain-containing protein [Coniochaeta ligniaria NRRL 30616]|uniref:HET-domain-containing protein n=1 Tax=Coniochaeta ligniaria NRRL 30616 TaxID=1408157 RepID=A0A1J7J0T4_9PEZI|nr:HET-domain-containing protein [Coniochaeta ligniaria NRRL 30616]
MTDITFEACDVCFNLQYSAQHDNQPLNLPSQVDGGRIIVVRDIDAFEASSTQGCPICKFIVQAVAYFELPAEDCHTIVININGSSEARLFFTGTCTTIQVYTPIGHQPAWKSIINSQELSAGPDSQEAYAFIETCLARCDQHPLCKPGSSRLPTRLVDVGSIDDLTVRLVETSFLPQRPYIALSYCCGPNMVFKTTLANYQAHKRGIPVSSLPKTIQDAVTITRKLKEPYLWIDAICIIQELPSDWEFESLNMATVYRNAHLTLAAATSPAVTAGFLHQPHFASKQKPPFLATWTTNNPAAHHPSLLGARIVPSPEAHEQSDAGSYLPLSHRGWTLQERLLARRVVTYAPDELWWTCLSGWTCECTTFDKCPRSKPVYSLHDPAEAYEYWQRTVGEFTDRELTDSLDRFPAMSGLASAVRGITGSGYVAGLWEGNFVGDLAWRVATFEGPGSSDSAGGLVGYHAPTFSWASVGQSVYYGYDQRWVTDPSCVVLGIEADVPGENPLGRVQAASATLRCLLFETTLEVVHLREDTYVVPCAGMRHRITADTALETFQGVNGAGVVERSVCRCPVGSSKAPAVSGTPVFLVHLGSWRGPRLRQKKDTREPAGACLLLGKSPRDMDKYERLGMVTGKFLLDEENLRDFTEAVVTLV